MNGEVDPEDKTLITPATTPGSPNGHFSVSGYYSPQVNEEKSGKYVSLHFPFVIILASLLQIALFFVTTPELQAQLRFDPQKQYNVWRFASYMLIHDSWQHLSINVVLQCLFAIFLEKIEGWWRVLTIYVTGGIGGALGAACLRPELLVGASAGVYALLTSLLSYIILNFPGMKYRIWKLCSIVLLIISDAIYNVIHHYGRKGQPNISIGAHVFGALFGFLVGLLLYSTNYKSRSVHKAVICTSGFLFVTIFGGLLFLNLHVNKQTSVISGSSSTRNFTKNF